MRGQHFNLHYLYGILNRIVRLRNYPSVELFE